MRELPLDFLVVSTLSTPAWSERSNVDDDMENETHVDTQTLLDDARQKLIDKMDFILDKKPIEDASSKLHATDQALCSVFVIEDLCDFRKRLISAEASSSDLEAGEDQLTAEQITAHCTLCVEKERLVMELVDAVVATKQVSLKFERQVFELFFAFQERHETQDMLIAACEIVDIRQKGQETVKVHPTTLSVTRVRLYLLRLFRALRLKLAKSDGRAVTTPTLLLCCLMC